MAETVHLEIREKHSLAIRWFHWINFPVLALMIWSGLLIYWAYDPYMITFPFPIFGKKSIHFFPEWFNVKFHLESGLSKGQGWHYFIGWIFGLNGLAYVTYLAVSGEWRHVLPKRDSLKESIHVILHDLFLVRKPPTPDGFNGAQRFAYTGVVFMGLGSLVTGIAIYKPVQALGITSLLGGYQFCRILHFALMLSFVAFFCVHVAQVIRAGWNNFRAMITGKELVKVGEGSGH